MRTPVTFSNARPQPFRAPSIGEHSATIAREFAGLSSEVIEALDAAGVFK
jgi:crotonobetainyl-CoA:carnitine CoA-transferase CaiB-like acyl-CoA transferase